MSTCLIVAGQTIMAAAFSLSWTHSVERTRWEESWHVKSDGMQIFEARVKGSGAGIDPPDGSVLKNDWWTFHPKLPSQKRLVLASSGATGGGWKFCTESGCKFLGATAGPPTIIQICEIQK